MISALSLWACEPLALESFLKRRLGPCATSLIDVRASNQVRAAAMQQQNGEQPPAIAIIRVSGVMLKEADEWDEYFGATSMRRLTAAVNAAAGDAAVKAIALRIDSPGGSVDGLEEFGAAVKAAADKKNIVAIVDGLAASAAYYVASQTREIIAGPTDLVGSIGTKLVMYDLSKMVEADGIRVVVIDTGEFKSTGEPGTPLTDSQEAYLRGIVDFYFRDFRAKVRAGRSMDAKAFDAVSDGRVFPAPEAKSLGLVDKLMRPMEAIQGLLSKYATKPKLAAWEGRRKLSA